MPALSIKISIKLTGVYSRGIVLLHIEKLRLAVQSVLANIYEDKYTTVTAENTLR